MKKILPLILTVFMGTCFGAARDITHAEVDPLGYIKLTFNGMDSSGTHNFGWIGADSLHADTSGIIGFIGVKRMGYDSITGVRNFMYDTVMILSQISRDYPLEAYDSCEVFGSDSTSFWFAPNKTIYVQDTVKWISIASGIYSVGLNASNAYEAFSMINNSQESYDSIKVIGNQSWPVGQRFVVDSDFRFSVVAAHESARKGKLVQCVEFFAQDEHSNTWDTLVNHSVANWTDSLKNEEFACNINLSGMTKNDTITVTWKIKPIYGDSLYSGDGVNTPLTTPYYSAKKFFYSERTALVVDGATGSDAANASVALDDFNPASPPAAFATIGGAINYCRTLAGATDLKGRYKIFVRSGNYAQYGVTITSGTFSSFVFEICNFPGETFKINSIAGSAAMPGDSWMMWKGCTLSVSTGNVLSGENCLILDSVVDNRTGGTVGYNDKLIYVKNCKFINDDVDLPFGSGTSDAPAIIRGTEFRTVPDSRISPFVFISNKVSGGFSFSDSVLINPIPKNIYIGSNYITTTGCVLPFYSKTNLHHGLALVQNIFEKTTTISPALQLAADGSTSQSVNNIFVANNVGIGERWNNSYCDFAWNGTGLVGWRKHWSFRNNILHRTSRGVTSWHAHSGPAGTGRYGNWMVVYGRDVDGDLVINNIAEDPSFWGIRTAFYTVTYNNIGTMNSFIKFKDDNSYCGGGGGNGDYHLDVGSPAISFSKNQVKSFDLDGNTRGLYIGAAGAYEYESDLSISSIIAGSCTLGIVCTLSVTNTAADSIKWQYYRSGTWTDTLKSAATGEDTLFRIPRDISINDSIRATVWNTVTADTSDPIWWNPFYTIPVFDSLVSVHQRGILKTDAWVMDTVAFYFEDQGDSTEYSEVRLNSTGTIQCVLVSWGYPTLAIIPSGTPRGYYRPRMRGEFGILSANPSSNRMYVKIPKVGP